MKSFLLLLTVALIGWKAPVGAAQEAALSLQIIDVLPAVDAGATPQSPFLSCDFLIGSQVRPSWWGQSFEDRFQGRRKIAAQLQVTQNANIKARNDLDGSVVSVQWNEALGLYLYHTQFYWKETVWTSRANYTIKGELPTLLPGSPALPFALSFATPDKRAFPSPTLDSPQPQVWVRSIRVAPRENYEKEGPPFFPYEARITVAGRSAEKRTETRYAPEFFDLTGKEPPSPLSKHWGLEGGLGHQGDIFNQLLPQSGIEFLTYRVVFNQGVFESSPDLFFRQTLEVGGRAPLTVSFPVKRDGVLLSGEIAPREWQFGENKGT